MRLRRDMPRGYKNNTSMVKRATAAGCIRKAWVAKLGTGEYEQVLPGKIVEDTGLLEALVFDFLLHL